jgi:predicted alpha/beta-hydrolase family hydrolase
MPDPLSGRSVVLAPGANNSAQIPLLLYSWLAAQRRGASVMVLTWDFDEERNISEQRGMVTSKVEAAVAEVIEATGIAPLVIGKSLGSLAAPVAAEQGLAAIWFTPLLAGDLTVAPALGQATAPFLLAGGTADPFWDGRVARSLPGKFVEIEDADHAMFVPGPLAASVSALGQVLTAVEHFLDHTVWPQF